MKNISLKELIYKNYLKTSLASIIFIELVLLIIYFTANSTLSSKNIEYILADTQKNTYSLVEDKISIIENKLLSVESLLDILRKEEENFFSSNKSFLYDKKAEFDYAQNKMYYKKYDNGGSSVVVSKETKITEDLKKELEDTEFFDLSFKTIVNHDSDFVAAYYNSRNNYSRYYPFLENIYDVFPSDINMKNYNFYYLADEFNNPEKKLVWTDVYLDPAKKGWLISVIAPIYNMNNELEGVTGIDITLENFINSFLNLSLPYEGKSFIINKDANIVAMQNSLKKIFKLDENLDYKYKDDEKIDNTVYKKRDFDILNSKNKAFANNLKNLIDGKSYQHIVVLNNEKYLFFSKKISKTSWYVISLIKEENILHDINELKNEYLKIGYSMIALIIFFYVGFFIFLNLKAKNFVKQINEPLVEIIKLTKRLGKRKNLESLKSTGIKEIDKLNENFNLLANELDNRTNKLIEEETKRVYHEKLANTDSLTGAYNRRYLEIFSAEYLKIVKRNKEDFSILMVDLDDFKIINDKFGHEEGDNVLKIVVSVFKECIRENDLIIRYGGDEFILLLPNTSKENAKVVSQKIVNKIKEIKNDKYNFTVSIGISQYLKDDTMDSIIKRADELLYKAKKMGKNKIF